MNVVDTLRALVRRWYIVVPGIVVAGVLAAFVFAQGKTEYERSASMLLIPAETSIPKDANPFLYISGLGQTADVLVRAVGAPAVVDDIVDEHPDVEVVVERDPTTASPLLVIKVTSTVDAEAALVLDTMIEDTHEILATLQDDESIRESNQVTAIPLTVDPKGTASQKSRIIAAGGVGVVLVAVTILVAALVEAVAGRRRMARATRAERAAKAVPPTVTPIASQSHASSVQSRAGGG